MSGTGFLGGLVEGITALRQQQQQQQQFQQELQLRQHQFDFLSMMKEKEFDQNAKHLEYLAGVQAKQRMFDLAEKKAQFGLEQQKVGIEQQKLEETKRKDTLTAGQGQTNAQAKALFDMLKAKSSKNMVDLQSRIAAGQQIGEDTSALEQQLQSENADIEQAQQFITGDQGGGQPQGQAAPAPAQPTTQAAPSAAPGEAAGAIQDMQAPPPSGQQVTQATMPGMGGTPVGMPPPPPAPGLAPGTAPRTVQVVVPNAAIAQRYNEAAKVAHSPRVFVTEQQMTEEQRKLHEDQVKDEIAQASKAVSYAPTIEDALKRNGVDLMVDATPQRTIHKSATTNVHAGGVFSSVLRAGFSENTGYTEKERPNVDFLAGNSLAGLNADGIVKKDPELADKIAQTLLQHHQQYPDAPIQPFVEAAQKVVRVTGDTIKDLQGKKPLVEQPFDNAIDPRRALAVKMAKGLPDAEAKLALASTSQYVPTGMVPEVTRGDYSPKNVLTRFGKAMDLMDSKSGNRRLIAGFIGSSGGPVPKMTDDPQAEKGLITELQASLRPDQPDGTFSVAASEQARKTLAVVKDSSLSAQAKAQAAQILAPIAAGVPPEWADTEVGQGQLQRMDERALQRANPWLPQSGPDVNLGRSPPPSTSAERQAQSQMGVGTPPILSSTPTTPTLPIKKATSQAESKGGRIPGPLGALATTLMQTSLGAQQDVTDAAAAAKKVDNATKNKRVEVAIAQAPNIAASFRAMTKDEKKNFKPTWDKIKKKWQGYGVSDSTINTVDQLVYPPK